MRVEKNPRGNAGDGADPLEFVLSRIPDAKRSGNGWLAKCPSHNDRNPSLSISHGADGRCLLKCFAQCSVEEICKAIGIDVADLFPRGDSLPASARNNGRATKPTPDFERLVLQFSRGTEPDDLESFASELGVDPDSLIRLDTGWDGSAWCFPMRDASGTIIGIRRRLPDGKKLSVKGSQNGLFIPIAVSLNGTLFIAEGESDTAALLTLGLNAIGRPSCTGGVDLLREYCNGRNVVIVSDCDEPGRKGAESLARELVSICESVRVIEPTRGAKDARAWIQGAATKLEIEKIACKAKPLTPDAAGPSDSFQSPIEWQSFPLDALPPIVRDYVECGSKALGVDPAFIALPMLAVLASVIGTTRRIMLKQSWSEPSILWTAIIARSGSLKSPALEFATTPLKGIQSRAFAEHEAELKLHADSNDENTEAPTCQRYLVGDATIEAIAPILRENPRGVLLLRDELNGWLRGFDRYRSKVGGDAAAWVELFHSRSILIDRKTGDRRTIHVPRAAVSICGTIQPATLARTLGQEHFENGLASRFLMAMPPTRAKKWTDSDVSPEWPERIGALLERLHSLEHNIGLDGDNRPIDIPLSSDAKRLWTLFYDEHARTQHGASTDDLAAAYSKLEAVAARLALVDSLTRWASSPDAPEPTAIDKQNMESGIRIAQWFVHETARVYGLLADATTDSERQSCMKLESIIRAHGGRITPRDLAHAVRAYRASGAAERALSDLESQGRGQFVYEGRSRVFVLND